MILYSVVAMKKSKIKTSLGELEAEIMEAVWNLESASVRQILNRLKKKRDIAYTTVMTVMGRLCDKLILKRKFNGDGAYVYTAVQAKSNFLAAASKRAISGLLKEFGEVAVAQFVDAVESSSLKNLEEWREKLKKIK